jgi:hypothetical protein
LSEYGLSGEMVYGSVIDVEDKPLGSMTFNVKGDKKKIIAMLNLLVKNSDIIDYGYGVEPQIIPKGGKIK